MTEDQREALVQVGRAVSKLPATEAIGVCMAVIAALWAEGGFRPSLGLIHEHLDKFAQYEVDRAAKRGHS